MTRTYTAADFANAQFAEHPDGRRAVRTSTPVAPWIMEMRHGPGHCAKDSEMALDGWVPVPTKPQITESEFLAAVDDVIESQYATAEARCREFTQSLGIEVIPDPEPTNTDRLAKLLGEVATDAGVNLNPRLFAEQLDNAGVTVNKENN